MGLYFPGRVVLEDTVLRRLFDRKPYTREDYSVSCIDGGNRLWMWTNLQTARTIITGDEGNGWCVPLIDKPTPQEAVEELRIRRINARFRGIGDVLQAFANDVLILKGKRLVKKVDVKKCLGDLK